MLVTTTTHPSSSARERASAVGARCDAVVVERTGPLLALMRSHDARLAYVVGRQRDELRSCEAALFVHAGMFKLKRELGRQHPLVRAVLRGGTCTSIVDATIGLAADALHLAAVLGVSVRGIEASPVVFSLLEEGLPRLAAGVDAARSAAARVSVELGDAHDVLRGMPDGSTDVVVLDPMFPVDRRAAPGFELLRAVAHACPDRMGLIEEARRVARSHVVLKVPKRPQIPECDERIDGKALRYLIFVARGARPATSSWTTAS